MCFVMYAYSGALLGAAGPAMRMGDELYVPPKADYSIEEDNHFYSCSSEIPPSVR